MLSATGIIYVVHKSKIGVHLLAQFKKSRMPLVGFELGTPKSPSVPL